MSAQEVKLYQTHPTRGMEILSSIRSVPSDVLQIISHHHENCIGSGWPAGIRKNHIHPLARIVSVADEFCRLVLKTPDSDPMPIPDALENLCAIRRQEFDAGVLDSLLKVFKAEVAKKLKALPA